jgi:chromosome segregation ATPase
VSDAAITTIVSGAVTITLAVIGYLDMRGKLKRGNEQAELAAEKAEQAVGQAKAVEEKIDANTAITKKIDGQTNGGLDDRFADHADRIAALETKVNSVDAKQDSIVLKQESLDKNINSTRHEMRGHFQTISNALSLLNARGAKDHE